MEIENTAQDTTEYFLLDAVVADAKLKFPIVALFKYFVLY